MFAFAGAATGWTAAFLTGGVWGVVVFSWGLPLPLPVRIAATILLVVALSSASSEGRLAAGAFSFGFGASAAVLVASSGLLFVDLWSLLPAAGLANGLALHWLTLRA